MAYKTFLNGYPLPASELNTYLMQQSVATFANATERSTAITSPVEGQLTYLEDSNQYFTYTGSAWTPLVAPVSPNAIINGAFDIWQRGTSFTDHNSFQAATSDRWAGYRGSIVSGLNITRQSSGLTGFQYCARVQRASGNTSTNDLFFGQWLETVNSIQFAGQNVTLSFYARAGANYSPSASALRVNLNSGTGTDQNFVSGFTNDAQVINATATLTTTWQRFTFTGAIASTATQLAVLFKATPVGTAGAADYFEVTGVQLEVGSVATPFRRNANSIQGELAACQRYYQRWAASSTTSWVGGRGNATNTTTAYIHFNALVSMRTKPTSVDYANLRIYDDVTYTSVSSASLLGSSTDVDLVAAITVASGLTQFRSYALTTDNVNLSYIGFNAEL